MIPIAITNENGRKEFLLEDGNKCRYNTASLLTKHLLRTYLSLDLNKYVQVHLELIMIINNCKKVSTSTMSSYVTFVMDSINEPR